MPPASMEHRVIGIVKISPEPTKAVIAIETASNMIEAAQSEIDNGKYEDAWEDAKNAIRMAAAAIMYDDGYITNTMEGALEYIGRKYERPKLVKEWKEIEIKSPANRGWIYIIGEIVGISKKQKGLDESEVRKALSVAETFIEIASAQILSSMTPVWNNTKNTE